MNYDDLGVIQGSRMLCPEGDKIGARLKDRRVYEPRTTETVLRGIPAGGLMIDVGAHVGYFTLMAAKAAGPEGRVYSIEPDPANFAVLIENIRLNGLENVRALNFAAWDKSEPLAFFPGGPLGQIDPSQPAGEAHKPGPCPKTQADPTQPRTVYGRALDETIGHLNADLIKIDVQGAEARAIAGMPNAIRNARAVIVEIWPAGLRQFGNTENEILTAFREAGLEAITCTKDPRPARTFDFSKLEGYGAHIEIYASRRPGPAPWQLPRRQAGNAPANHPHNANVALSPSPRPREAGNGETPQVSENGGKNGH